MALVRHHLEGHDAAWRATGGEMAMVPRLLDDAGREVERVRTTVDERSTNWSEGQGLSGATIYTDGGKSYDGLFQGGCKHHRIYHPQNQFARGRNHVNGIESFWSFTKLRLAKLRGIRSEYFFLHLKESEWRWNHRRDNLYVTFL